MSNTKPVELELVTEGQATGEIPRMLAHFANTMNRKKANLATALSAVEKAMDEKVDLVHDIAKRIGEENEGTKEWAKSKFGMEL